MVTPTLQELRGETEMVYVGEHFVSSKMLLVSKYYWCSGRLVGLFLQSKF